MEPLFSKDVRGPASETTRLHSIHPGTRYITNNGGQIVLQGIESCKGFPPLKGTDHFAAKLRGCMASRTASA